MQYSNYLAHYGVLGMKWGVRRYQNKDGSRTALGRRRERKNYKEERKSYRVSAKETKKNMDYMTDQELRTALNRLNMQREVNQMTPDLIRKGESRLKRYISIAGTLTAAVAVTDKLLKIGK